MKVITLSALLLIASLSQAAAQRNEVRMPCFANVCIVNGAPLCSINLFGPVTFMGEPFHCFCRTRKGTMDGFMEFRRLPCGPSRPR
jgi:hypothetical protein